MNYKKILEENKDNFELLRDLVLECNSWNGSLESYEVFDFDDDFFQMFFENKVIDAVRAVHFGNIDSWSDEYIRFNGYGNLESLSDYQYEEELKENADEIIETALELENKIDLKDIVKRNNLEEEEN